MKSNAKFFMPLARTVVGILFASLIGVVSAQTPAAGSASGPVATLGKVKLEQADVQRLFKNMSNADRATILSSHATAESWLRQRITGEAVVQEARTKGWADKPEIKARINDAVKEITERIISTAYLESMTQIPADYPSEAETHAAYDQAKGGFNLPMTYHIAQIFLKAPSNDTAAVANARAKAIKLAAQAHDGDFAALARSNSNEAASAVHGGDVGVLPLANILPELQDTVAKMKKGQVSDPIQTGSGFHIVKLLDTQAPRTATYEEIKPRLQAVLRQQRQQQVVQTYLTTLAPAGSITINGAALDVALAKAN
ncbi:MAG: ppiC [Herbaspirillum sp.]|jgi:peptidylprolyl isomerase|nr:ppiC [Herbaspirillum sp.]